MNDNFINFAYLIASILFILGLKGMTRPKTAVRGNLMGASGMFIAVAATLFNQQILTFPAIVAGIVIGSAIGVYIARTVEMTSMPELVALFNGLGGLASFLVAFAAILSPVMIDGTEIQGVGNHKELAELAEQTPIYKQVPTPFPVSELVAMVLSGLIGAVTLSGSLIAYGKLSEADWVSGMQEWPGGSITNLVLVVVSAALAVWIVTGQSAFAYFLLVVVGLILGVGLVVEIGGADMPVVIALLNSYSGLAASATGFVLNNNVLIISGALVGASGLILTQIMCKAMNRSLTNVLFGGIDAGGATADADEVYENVKSTSAEEVAMLLEDARKVVIIPGYGMAVAQAQHAVRDLTNTLNAREVTVEFGIHPVAGRMPGHMNVLLAEADIPYDLLIEMDDVNAEIEQADVVLVIGANDTVNPDARENPQSPIAGMPIIDADKARTVVVIKRSLSPGYAGIPNPLFAADNALMLFGDGKKAVVEIKNALEDA